MLLLHKALGFIALVHFKTEIPFSNSPIITVFKRAGECRNLKESLAVDPRKNTLKVAQRDQIAICMLKQAEQDGRRQIQSKYFRIFRYFRGRRTEKPRKSFEYGDIESSASAEV